MNRPPTPSPQSPPFNGLQRKLLALAGALGALVIALIVFHALHDGSTGLNAVAEAAERTARQPGSKLAIEFKYTIEGIPGQTTPRTEVGDGSGSYNARTGRATATITIPVPGHGSQSIDTVGDKDHIFLSSPLFAGELPPGKEWLGMEPFLGHDPETAFGSNGSAESQLGLLEAVGGGVEKLDQQTVRGYPTTRYRGTVELARAAQLFSERGETELAQEFERSAEQIPDPIPVEAWIDQEGLTRQVRAIEPLPSKPGDAKVTMDIRMQFYAFGTHPKIKLPPKRAVFDYTPIMRAELGLEDGSTLGPLAPPAGARPLSAVALGRQGTAICRRVDDEAGRLLARDGELAAQIRGLGLGQTARTKRLVEEFAEQVGRPFHRKAVRLVRELAALDPPPSLAGEYRRYLWMKAIEAEWGLAQIRQWELGATKHPALKARETQADEEELARKRVAADLGLSTCEKKLRPAGDSPATTDA